MKVFLTGGAGFIGSNFVHHMLREHPDYDIVVLDKLTYAGNLKNLEGAFKNPRFKFIRQDICDPAVADAMEGVDAVVHMAAESHVDRSIENADDFVRTNVEGTWRMLDACRHAKVPRFLHVSTDEVYGSLGATGKFTEQTPISPNSPYSATKASSDLLALAYFHTHKFPALVTRCSNNYGPYQFPEKFIPLMIAQAGADQPLPVYGKGENVRDWIHVDDHCRALDVILHKGRVGEVYNIGGNSEMRNIDVVRMILSLLGKPESLLKFVTDRPGHDLRYAIDSTKMKQELGWEPRWKFSDGLTATVRWYQENAAWLEETRSGAYRDYFDRHYHRREQTFAAGQ
jgi:dTDP-glucose 4,6-dehydratase